MSYYTDELYAQKKFYETYLPRVDSSLDVDEVFEDNTDGILNGNILEFKLVINNLSKVLFQVIKYLSARRLKGRYVPRNIILISLNTNEAFSFNANDYLHYIEKVYLGGASRNDDASSINASFYNRLDLSNDLDIMTLIHKLREQECVKVHIDENDIVGWGRTYYKLNPTGSKQSFLGDETGKVTIAGEIRNPNVLDEFILPYKGKSNYKFGYLLDKLNDRMKRKDLGAFYTPQPYADKSLDLVREAINNVPGDHDYIILDRCAGTGNLEQHLSNEELGHVVLNTYEYYEYKVLVERLADKVRYIVPPIEKDDTFMDGLVRGSNALSSEFLYEPYIQKCISDEKTNIIMFENPPYTETSSIEHQKIHGKKNATWKDNFIVHEMKDKIKKNPNVSGQATNDMGNVFIWSAFEYYLTKPNDAYVVYSPVKYWKVQHLVNKNLVDGYAFNRHWFHTNINATIAVSYFSNDINSGQDDVYLKAYDLSTDKKDVDYLNANLVELEKPLPIHKVFTTFSKKYYDSRRPFDHYKLDGIVTGLNGKERPKTKSTRVKPIYSDDMLGYMVADSSGFDNPDLHSSLLVAGRYNANGFFIHKDNYLEKLPMFAATRYIKYNRDWTERARIFKSGDGSNDFYRDIKSGKLNNWLKKVLIFTIFEPQNHMRSFKGSDGRKYRNELSLDVTNGSTIASRELEGFHFNDMEQNMIKLWNNIMSLVKRENKNYDHNLTYGLYQVDDELNTYHKDEMKNIVYDYPELYGYIKSIKSIVRDYYLEEIVPKLFEYKFLR